MEQKNNYSNRSIFLNLSKQEDWGVDRLFLNLFCVLILSVAFDNIGNYLDTNKIRSLLLSIFYFLFSVFGFIKFNNLLSKLNPYILLDNEKIVLKNSSFKRPKNYSIHDISSINTLEDKIVFNLKSGRTETLNLGWLNLKIARQIKEEIVHWTTYNLKID